jgi:hypothetical protein
LAAGVAEAATAGFAGAGALGGTEASAGGEGLLGVVVVSDGTDPEGVVFTPLGLAG